MRPAWQLPPGVSRGLWDYVHDPAAAQAYDQSLGESNLFNIDQQFVRDYCRPPGRFLDLGCGTGRLALGLAREGFKVLAVDLSEEMLRIVGAKAEQAGLHVDRLQVNLVELDALADRSWDYAACLFGTLGLIDGAPARRRFLEHVQRLLVPGGRFILHVHNRWFHTGTRAGRRLLWSDLLGWFTGSKRPGDYLMPAHDGIPSMPMHLFTRREIVRLLRQAGFRLLEIRPISLREDGRLRFPFVLGSLRAYGYLVATEKS